MINDLIDTSELPDLGPRARDGIASESDLNARLRPMLAEAKISGTRADLIRATVLLWHDHLDAAHTIVQDIETPDGSYLHAIMHRREPDFSNSKYWFHRVGKHPCFAELTRRVSAMKGAQEFVRNGEWDPFAFVKACERDPNSATLRQIQAEEIRAVLDSFQRSEA